MNRFMKMTAWLLVCSVLCLTFAAGPALAEDSFDILTKLIESISQDPTEGRLLDDPESVDAYCQKLYKYLDEDVVDSVFYNGPDEAAELIKKLSGIIYETELYADVTLTDAEAFYVYVWTILHSDISESSKSRPAVKEIMKDVFSGCSDQVISDATDLCMDYIIAYEPQYAVEGYEMNRHEKTTAGNADYKKYYDEGYQLFEEGKYEEAIQAYSKSLEYLPDDMVASFEIAEAYIAMRDYAHAKSWLSQIKSSVRENSYKAQWLRRMGFIAIEEMDCDLASALYTYSLEFEKSSLADQELGYIRMIAPDTKQFTAEEAKEYLKENGITME